MARGTQFGVITTRIRNEVGRSNTAGTSGVADFNQIKELINKHYELLYADFDWPHLRQIFSRITLAAGDRYYNVPSGLDYERIERVVVWNNGRPLPVERGISFDDYAAFSSEDNERSGPVLKWDMRWTGAAPQIEVWPTPGSNDQKLQIQGFKQFVRLLNDQDLCLLDDNLIVAFVSAEMAAGQGAKDAQVKLSTAQAIYNKLRGRSKAAGKVHVFGGEAPPKRLEFTVAVR